MLVAERPRAAPKEGILFRHQPFALAKSQGTMGGALIPFTLHLGFKHWSPALHQAARADFSEEGRMAGEPHPCPAGPPSEDTNHGD